MPTRKSPGPSTISGNEALRSKSGRFSSWGYASGPAGGGFSLVAGLPLAAMDTKHKGAAMPSVRSGDLPGVHPVVRLAASRQQSESGHPDAYSIMIEAQDRQRGPPWHGRSSGDWERVKLCQLRPLRLRLCFDLFGSPPEHIASESKYTHSHGGHKLVAIEELYPCRRVELAIEGPILPGPRVPVYEAKDLLNLGPTADRPGCHPMSTECAEARDTLLQPEASRP